MKKDWKELNNGSLAKLRTMGNSYQRRDFFCNNFSALLLVFISTLLVSFAQVAFKMAWKNEAIISYFLLSKVLLGLGLYALGAILFMVALRNKKVSYLFPFLTLSYVWVILLSAYLFGEVIGVGKILGVSLIFTGIFLIYISGRGGK